MDSLEKTFVSGGVLHHAYFMVGDADALARIFSFLQNTVGVATKGNPDFWHGTFGTFTITHARSLADSQERKSFDDNKSSRKIFIIQANFITEEAQNALLKVFEEPTAGTHFFIISPQDMLLPTLRSRMQVIQFENEQTQKTDSVLKMKFSDRLAKVKEITEGIADEEKTKQDAIALLNSIERELYNRGVEKSAHELSVTESARTSLYDRGAPVKMILEQVMLSI